MKSFLLPLSLLASAAFGVVAAEELGIDVTLPVECERKTKSGDKIFVHYRGTLTNGNKFDASYDRGQPFSFKLGGGQVIRGWDEGLLDMCIGEKRTLTVPPSLGYGQRSVGPIPAGSTLIFETELIGIDGVPKPQSIVTKEAEATPEPAAESEAESTGVAEAASSKIAEKVASKVSEAAEVVKTVVADSDDTQEHNEL